MAWEITCYVGQVRFYGQLVSSFFLSKSRQIFLLPKFQGRGINGFYLAKIFLFKVSGKKMSCYLNINGTEDMVHKTGNCVPIWKVYHLLGCNFKRSRNDSYRFIKFCTEVLSLVNVHVSDRLYNILNTVSTLLNISASNLYW